MNSSLLRLALLLLAAALSSFAIAGCQTAHGFGQDVSHLGDKIQDKSN